MTKHTRLLLAGVLLILPSAMLGQGMDWKDRCRALLRDNDYPMLLHVIDSLRSSNVQTDSADAVKLHSMYSLGAFQLRRHNEAEHEAWSAYRIARTYETYMWIHTVIGRSRERAEVHLRQGMTLFPGDPNVMYELSDHFMLYGKKDSAKYWFEQSLHAGIQWGRYIQRYDNIMQMYNRGVLDEADAQMYVDEWEKLLQYVFLRTYERIPSNLRLEYLRQNTSYAQTLLPTLLTALIASDTMEEQKYQYCHIATEMLTLMPLVDSDTASYGYLLEMIYDLTYAMYNAGRNECYEALIMSFTNLLVSSYPDRIARYLDIYKYYCNRLSRKYRFAESETAALRALEYASKSSDISTALLADMSRAAGQAMKLQGRNEDALSCYHDAKHGLVYITEEDRVLFALSYAMALQSEGNDRAASDEAYGALAAAEEISSNDPRQGVQCLVWIAQSLLYAHDYHRARVVLTKTMNYLPRLPYEETSDTIIARVYLLMSKTHYAMTQYDKASEYLKQAVSLYSIPRSQHDNLYLEILSGYYGVAVIMNQNSTADSVLGVIIAYVDTSQHSKLNHLSSHLLNIALLLARKAEPVLAEQVYRRIASQIQSEHELTEAVLYRRYANALYAYMSGRMQSARQQLKNIVQAYSNEKLPPSATLLYSLRELARLSAQIGESSAPYVIQYKNIAPKLLEPVDSAFLYDVEIIDALTSKDYAGALRMLHAKRDAARKVEIPPYLSTLIDDEIALAVLMFLNGDTVGFHATIKGLANRIKIPDRSLLLSLERSFPVYLSCLLKTSEPSLSSMLAGHSIDTLIAVYEETSQLLTEQEAGKYYVLYSQLLNHMVTAILLGVTTEYGLQELAYRDDYRRSFFQTYRHTSGSMSDTDNTYLHRLRRELMHHNEQIELLASSPSLDPDLRRDSMIILYDRLHELQKQQRLAAQDSRHRAKTDRKLRTLREGEASVRIISATISEFLQPDSIVYLALVEKHDGSIAHTVLPNGRSMDSLWYSQYISAVKGRRLDDLSYERFWKQIDAMLGDVRTVYLLPDGVYAKINVETLWNDRGSYVADQYDVIVLTDFFEKASAAPSSLPRTATLVGYPDYSTTVSDPSPVWSLAAATRAPELDSSISRGYSLKPLPGTKTEILGIDSLMQSSSWKTQTFIGRDATKENLRNAPQSTIIHIATHGYFARRGQGERRSRMDFLQISDNEVMENPLLSSGVFLAGADKVFAGPDDSKPPSTEGLLSAFEISSWDLSKTALVVLSACETGLGYTVPGQSVYGLQRGITTAGARQVVQSLWVVDDAVTRDLMLEMYKQIARGMPYRDALQRAKMSIRARHPDPFHWGAFIHVQ